jgi:hypothetical protein
MATMPIGQTLRVAGRAPRCPSCRGLLDGAAVLGELETPQPAIGDLTVCGYCGAALMFDDSPMRCRLLSQEEVAQESAARPEFRAALLAAEMLQRQARKGRPS